MVAEVPEQEIKKVKREELTKPVMESIRSSSYLPGMFRVILGMAIRALEFVIVKAKESMREKQPEVIADEKEYTLFAIPQVPVKPTVKYDFEEMATLYQQVKGKEEAIFCLQKERKQKEEELARVGKLNMIKRGRLAEEIRGLTNRIEEAKYALSKFMKGYGFENAAVFMKAFWNESGKLNDYQKETAEWKKTKQQIEVTNRLILQGELSLEMARMLLAEKGINPEVVRVKESELYDYMSVKDRMKILMANKYKKTRVKTVKASERLR